MGPTSSLDGLGVVRDETVKGVGCGVKDCKYHGAGNSCTASHINVENERARRKAETFCSTFMSKNDG